MNFRILLSLSMLYINSVSLFALGVQTFSKELTNGSLAKVGEVVTYDLKSACNSLTSDCGILTITDSLPDGMVIDSCVLPSGFTATQCTVGTKDIEITKDTIFEGGDSFVLQIKALIELDASSTVDIVNSATSVITSPSDPSNEILTSNSGAIDVQDRVPNWKIYKTRISPLSTLQPTWDTDVTYQLKFCSLSAIGNVGLSSVIMEDVFPNNVVVVNDGGGTLSATNTLTWDLGDIDLITFYAGKTLSSTQCINKNYVLRYPSSDFSVNDTIQNTVTVTANRTDIGVAVSSTDVLDDVIGIPTPGATLSKSANDVLPNEDLIWSVSANVDSSNAPIPDLKIYETFTPSTLGIVAKSISSGQWNSPITTHEINGSSVKSRIMTATDSEGDCTNANYTVDLTTGFIASPLSPIVYTLASNITCVRWEFQDDGADGPAVPRGWSMTTAPQVIEDTTSYAGVLPISVSNCVHATFTNFDLSTGNTGAQCGTANIEEATPEIISNKFVVKSSLKPGEETTFILEFKHDKADSTGATINPTITDLLPETLEFISWDSVTGLNGQDEPNLEIIDNYNGTNRKLLRFSWSSIAPIGSLKLDGTAGVDNPASFDENSLVRINFTARFKAGTLAGNYTNTMQFFDNSARVSCEGTPVQDSNDLDDDGDTTELICTDGQALIVLQAAVLGGEKWIKGDPTLEHIDTLNPNATTNAQCPNYIGFTRYPCVAQTTRSGTFEYLFKFINMGNEPLKDYIVYDVLPELNDVGVGEPLATTARATQWVPILQGAITANNVDASNALAQTGAIIEYSLSSNPCRPEVSSSSDESGWQTSCINDWTETPADYTLVKSFRIKLPFIDSSWNPASELQFKASMKAPDNALVSDVTLSSKLVPAWNSIAHRVTQASNNSRLPTAEPKRVGIVVPKGLPVSIGSVIWNDNDRNGIQNIGENLITESTVFTLKDSLNRYVTDNDNVLIAPKTSTIGTYIFSNLPEGNYTVTVQPNSHYIASPVQTIFDNDSNESDSNIKTNNANGTYTSGLFELTNDNEPIESNIFHNADDLDDSIDEDNGDMTVDFGFYRLSTLGNYVWYDADKDAIQESGEAGVFDVNVTLYQNCTTEISSMRTDGNGKYLFRNLEAGNYCVGFSNIPTGFLFTQKGGGSISTGSDVNLDSNKTDMISLDLDGEDDLTWDAGIVTPIISGTVFNDGNNDGTVNGTEISSIDGTQLYVTLLDSNNNLLSSVAVSGDGSYKFDGNDGITIDTIFKIVLTTTFNGSVPNLLPNWNNADGEHIGIGAGLDTTVDGKIQVNVLQSNIPEINFGINNKPIAINVSNPTQFNPGGVIRVNVPNLNISDREDGTPNIVTITGLPNNATLYYNSIAVTLDQNITGLDNSLLEVDPESGSQNITFTYTTTDKSNVVSDSATVSMPFTDLTISGHLYEDGNGNGKVDGTLISSADGVPLYATLVNGGVAVATKSLSAGGTYAFDIEDGVHPNTSYTVVLSKDSNGTTPSLPIDWDNKDGEMIGTIGTDGISDGILTVNVVTSDTIEANFGINKRPIAQDVVEPLQVNPGNATQVQVPDLNVSDIQDSTPITVSITNLPTNATVYYNGIVVIKDQNITNFDNSLLTIDPQSGGQNISFTYTTIDAAGTVSSPANITMSFANIRISGTLFHDGNGNTNVDGIEINQADGIIFYVTLLDSNGVGVSSKVFDANGDYFFESQDGLAPDSNYTIILTTDVNGITAKLPLDWGNEAGENIGLVGTDGNPNGSIVVEVFRSDIVEINFGINKKPFSMNVIEPIQFNPGSTTQVNVPDLNISDLEDGIPTVVTIKTLPTDGVLYYNGVEVALGVVGEYRINDFNNSKLTVDPKDDDVTVRFEYTSTDIEGVESDNATVTMPFSALKISGHVFNDGNNDNTINGLGISAPSGTQLYTTLLNNNGMALASMAINGDGTYDFSNSDGIQADTNYTVVLSENINGTIASLPTNWSNNDGEHIGSNMGTDGLNDGIIVVFVEKMNVVEVNFGINKKPIAGDYTEPLQLNPGIDIQVNVPDLNITDNEDNTTKVVTIVTLPTHGTLYYNAIPVIVGQVISDLNNSLLTIDPDNGDQTVSFTYTTTDIVGDVSDVATVSMLFDGLKISGNIFNDGNGDETVNGRLISDINATQLHVTLLESNGMVMATMPIEINGSYAFDGTDGIIPNTDYKIILSIESNATISRLVIDWNHADGEHIGTNLGLDANADGEIMVPVLTVDIPEINFAVNARPIAIDKEEPLQLNPGKNTQVTVPRLKISDYEDVTPRLINIKRLPSNAKLYYDDVAVVEDSNITDANLSKFTLDPDNGDVNVTFTYVSIDASGWESKVATVLMPFDGLEITGRVFVDQDKNNLVDGLPLVPKYNLSLYVTLIESNGSILASIALDENGIYQFDDKTGLVPDSNYTVVLSTEANVSVTTLPDDWEHANSDTNGTLVALVESNNIEDLNFGVNQQPVVLPLFVTSILNPESTRTVVVPNLNITRNEDNSTIATTITITNLPNNGRLYYDAVAVTEGQVIGDFNNSLLTIDPDEAEQIVVFNYTSTDNGGFESRPATVSLSFIDPDSDGDGITNSHDLDDDNDGILDSIELLTSSNGGDSDGDGVPDRLDLDSDNDGILDLEESNINPLAVDSDGNGVLDSRTDRDNDGVMDSADSDDNNPTSKGKVIPIDTDNDGKPDFQDVDSDNDGLSDLVEGGTIAKLDANNDGTLDNPRDSDGDGIADVVDPDNGGTPASTPDTDNDKTDNYRDLDSDGDTLLDVVEINGKDSNNDGEIDSVGTLIDGQNLPDENNNDIPDVLEVKLKDDVKIANPGEVVEINLLSNDAEDIDPTSIEIVIPDGFDKESELSLDKKSLIVKGEGTWFVNQKGIMFFTPEDGFEGSPTSISYKASNFKGTRSAVAGITIITRIILKDDAVPANANGPITVIPVLENDRLGANAVIHLLQTIEGETLHSNGTAVAGATLQLTDRIVVPGEGVWEVNNDVILFTAEDGFKGIPSPIYYIVTDGNGTKSNVAGVTLLSPCNCSTYSESSVGVLNYVFILVMVLLIMLLGYFFAGKEFGE